MEGNQSFGTRKTNRDCLCPKYVQRIEHRIKLLKHYQSLVEEGTGKRLKCP